MKPTLLVMAAGVGSRYGSLKQLERFGPNQQTLIEYALYDAMQSGFGKVVFVIRRALLQDFEQVYFRKLSGKINLSYVLQEADKLPDGFALSSGRTKPWGTGHAVWVSASQIHEPFAVINGDDFYGRQSFRLMAQELELMCSSPTLSGTYGMIAYPLRHTLSENGYVSRGVCEVDQTGYLQSVTERTQIASSDKGIYYKDASGHLFPLTGEEPVSMNLTGFTPGIFTHLEQYLSAFLKENINNLQTEFFLPSVINWLIRSGQARVKVHISPEKWFGVTYPEDKKRVEQQLMNLTKAGVYPENLWE